MGSEDREYFMLRAKQETAAARRCTNRQARGRHEELAWLYQMRVDYMDRGITGADDEPVLEALPRPFIIAA